ncbi:MAG: hypothetical protein CVT48_01710 [Thermoplasmata archaeon HGW-Thermoplasmata-1]|nr:MAG: hypothetical protein CVT48_01710 [Thermoplasmata archaeon HGW-Thermoplasmata-1]
MSGNIAIINASIHTMDPGNPHATAVVAKGGRILFVGSDEGALGFAAYATSILDANGKTILPGFTDAHTHLMQTGGRLAGRHDFAGCSNLAEFLNKVKTLAGKTDAKEWLMGYGFDESAWPEARLPKREELDEAGCGVALIIERVCGHLSVVNSNAEERLGIRTDDGRLSESQHLKARRALRPDNGEAFRGFFKVAADAHRLGITSVCDFVGRDTLGAYENLSVCGESIIPLRSSVFLFVTSPCEIPDTPPLSESARLRFGGIKAMQDGSIGARSAAVCECYVDTPGKTGELLHSQRELENIVAKSFQRGYSVSIHAIGDRAIDSVLCALKCGMPLLERRQDCGGNGKTVARIEHFELASNRHMDEAKEIGATLCMQPNFVGEWGASGGMYERALGRSRLQLMNRFGSVARKGCRLCFGSDGMPMGPLYGIHWAVNHPNEKERLTVDEAVAAYTRDAGAACGFAGCGVIKEGFFADFIVLSADPYLKPAKIKGIQVEATFLDGVRVFGEPLAGIAKKP